MKHIICTLLLIALAGGAAAEQAFSTLEERMTGKEFTATGLSKLSAEELAALNEWLRAHSVATLDAARPGAAAAAAGVAAGVDTRGFENKVFSGMDDSDIEARIKGSFAGWQDGFVFVLDNGMIWEQAESSTFAMPRTDDPKVIIERGAFGVWRLRVDGYNRAVKVNRIQ